MNENFNPISYFMCYTIININYILKKQRSILALEYFSAYDISMFLDIYFF